MKLDIYVQLGMRIKYLRDQRKLSQEDLALESNVSKNYLSDVECGRRNISLKNINKIANALNISISTLFLGVGDFKKRAIYK